MVDREEVFLDTFFSSVTQCAYDKAKELAEKERDTCSRTSSNSAAHTSGSWGNFMYILSQLAVAEKVYNSLLFLVPKSFLRKDNSLKATYEALKTECRKGEDWPRVYSTDPLVIHLCGQIGHFVSARLDMMEFYEKLSSLGTGKQTIEELLPPIQEIVQINSRKFHHPALTPLKAAFTMECETLSQLLEAHVELLSWRYLPCLLRLQEAHAKLETWSRLFHGRESRKLGFLKALPTPALYQWHVKLKAMTVAKFSLYFYDVLSRYTSSASEMKTFCAKQSPDYIHQLQGFQRKADALAVALVLDTNGLEDYKGPGYFHPKKSLDPPKGLNSYPAIFCWPDKAAFQFWPSVVMILTDKATELSTADRIGYLYDIRVQKTYFLMRIEPRITLVLIFDGKKSERDSYVSNTLLDLAWQLRGTKIFASLKQGSK